MILVAAEAVHSPSGTGEVNAAEASPPGSAVILMQCGLPAVREGSLVAGWIVSGMQLFWALRHAIQPAWFIILRCTGYARRTNAGLLQL